MDDYLRDVVETENFTFEIDAMRSTYSRIDEVHLGITWTLSRAPRVGTQLAKAPDFRVYETTAMGDTPAFWILYTFDENRVYLHSISPIVDGEEDE